ncbi:MAG: hypothetical protein ACK5HP_01695 [Bacilli bacterium]
MNKNYLIWDLIPAIKEITASKEYNYTFPVDKMIETILEMMNQPIEDKNFSIEEATSDILKKLELTEDEYTISKLISGGTIISKNKNNNSIQYLFSYVLHKKEDYSKIISEFYDENYEELFCSINKNLNTEIDEINWWNRKNVKKQIQVYNTLLNNNEAVIIAQSYFTAPNLAKVFEMTNNGLGKIFTSLSLNDEQDFSYFDINDEKFIDENAEFVKKKLY